MHHMTTSNSMAQCNTFWIFQAHAGVISTADIEGIVNHWTDRMDISEPSDFALLIGMLLLMIDTNICLISAQPYRAFRACAVQQYLKERGYEKGMRLHRLYSEFSGLPRCCIV